MVAADATASRTTPGGSTDRRRAALGRRMTLVLGAIGAIGALSLLASQRSLLSLSSRDADRSACREEGGERRLPSCDLTGLRVLLTGVHFEGNLGDEMETTPLLSFLRSGRAHVTAQLHAWQNALINANSARGVALVDAILMPEEAINVSDYDVRIGAPGPGGDWGADVIFGVSMRPKQIQFKHAIRPKTKLVVVREPLSYEALLSKVPRTTKLFMGADLSFSFPRSRAALDYWDGHFRRRGYAGFTLVFSRKGIFGKGVNITREDGSSTVHLQTVGAWGGSHLKSLPLDRTIFASSSVIEDGDHFGRLRKEYDSDHAPGKSRFVVCEQVEQLWALINMSKFVFTDRYHPGVAARIHDVPMMTLAYKGEQEKLTGLMRLSNTSASEMKSLNQEAFGLLCNILQRYRKTQN